MPVYNRHYWPDVSQVGAPDGLVWYGPVIPVEVAVPQALAQHLVNANLPVPAPIAGWALIDTGATITAIDTSVLDELGVPAVGVARVGTAGGPVQQNVFPARLSFTGTDLQDLAFNKAVGCDLSEFVAPGDERLIVLLGRDLLQYFVLVYNGPGGIITISH